MRLELCNEDGVYPAESLLTAQWRISRVAIDEIQSVEISVLWHTEGKGDEDLQVQFFHRISEQAVARLDLGQPQSIQCVLPPTPLSDQGRLISLRWCVRLRLYLSQGREIVAEQPFYLVAANQRAPRAWSGDDSSPETIDHVEDLDSSQDHGDHGHRVNGSVERDVNDASGDQAAASDLRGRFAGPILGTKRSARR